MSGSTRLKELLSDNTMVSAPELVVQGQQGRIRCLACGHRCDILPGRVGVCRVRYNHEGQLRAPSGYIASVQIDPIEKKPFFHAYPGRDALSFGMLGCDLHCSYCQNWVTSQALRDDDAVSRPKFCSPEQLVALTIDRRVPVMVSTYNEPLITADWAVEIFKLARAEGIRCGFISNGNATPEVLEFIRPYVDLYKVDLKGFNDKNYRQLGAALNNILSTIKLLVQMEFWVEIVTLLVPGFNDGDDEIKQMADFLAGVSPDLPWHVTAYHPDYKMADPPPTTPDTLVRAAQTGRAAGLKYVYAGNRPTLVDDWEHTHCPDCKSRLISRRSFLVIDNRMRGDSCPDCGVKIPGIWELDPPKTSQGSGRPMPIALR